MKKQQSGFTLIELVVVIVILGILAATAVPRFASITDDANLAVAQGITGALASEAAIGFAETRAANTLAAIIGSTDFSNVPTGSTIDGNAGTCTFNTGSVCTGAPTCAAGGGNSTITVTVGGQPSTLNLSGALCQN